MPRPHQRNVNLYVYSATRGDGIAEAYNEAGGNYVGYADGDPGQLFSFEGLHAYSDRRVWSELETILQARWNSGARSITILDAGCSPGTWLRHVVTRACAIGFRTITARGFDISTSQIRAARRLAHDLSSRPGVDLTFDVADLRDRLSEPDGSVDDRAVRHFLIGLVLVGIGLAGATTADAITVAQRN